jgi:hypothetical protein
VLFVPFSSSGSLFASTEIMPPTDNPGQGPHNCNPNIADNNKNYYALCIAQEPPGQLKKAN